VDGEAHPAARNGDQDVPLIIGRPTAAADQKRRPGSFPTRLKPATVGAPGPVRCAAPSG
jgi:hypothetical protein